MAVISEYVNEAGVEAIATHVNARLKKVSVMPETAEPDTTLLYIGETTASYTCGNIYKYDATDGWVAISEGKDALARELAAGAMALAQEVDDTKADKTTVGTLSSLTTTDKTDIVSAINEVDDHADTNTNNIGTLSSLTTTVKTDLVSAINELDSGKQDNLTTAQQNAVDSGITSAKVTQYDNYATNKQDVMQYDDSAEFPIVSGAIFQYTGTTTSSYKNGRFYKYDGSAYIEVELNDHTAATTTYNNAQSGLTATNVQSAIDELNTNISNIPDSIVPKGTIAFANLPALTDVTIGWMYNISDDFTTTSDFINSGVSEKAGSNVYVADIGSGIKKWDVFAVAPDIVIDQIYDGTSANPQSGVAVKGAIDALDVASVGGSGKYISAIEEVDGKIVPTTTNIDSTYSSSGTTAINGTAVADALATLDVSDSAVAGQYVSAVSETDGKISVTRASLPTVTVDQTYDGTSANPQSGVAVKGAIDALDVASVGGSGKYISAIEETDGIVSATATNLSTSVASGDSAPVTSDAVFDALNVLKGTVAFIGTRADYNTAKLIAEGSAGYIPSGALVIITDEDGYLGV